MFGLSAMVSFCVLALARTHDDICYDKLEYVLKVLERLTDVEKKLNLQKEEIAALKTPHQDNLIKELKDSVAFQEQKIAFLTSLLQDVEAKLSSTSQMSGDTYTRWGRSSCPNGTTLVYDGFAAGSAHSSVGGAANYLCLTKQPVWNDKTVDMSWSNNIYGAEYETVSGLWSSLNDDDVPCAVCLVPRRSVLMLPGKNKCHGNYSLEYSGYLMSGHATHESPTEFVCVDDAPESATYSSQGNQNGRLFFFVTAKCGSLKCQPYQEGKKLTCAVCSI